MSRVNLGTLIDFKQRKVNWNKGGGGTGETEWAEKKWKLIRRWNRWVVDNRVQRSRSKSIALEPIFPQKFGGVRSSGWYGRLRLENMARHCKECSYILFSSYKNLVANILYSNQFLLPEIVFILPCRRSVIGHSTQINSDANIQHSSDIRRQNSLKESERTAK